MIMNTCIMIITFYHIFRISLLYIKYFNHRFKVIHNPLQNVYTTITQNFNVELKKFMQSQVGDFCIATSVTTSCPVQSLENMKFDRLSLLSGNQASPLLRASADGINCTISTSWCREGYWEILEVYTTLQTLWVTAWTFHQHVTIVLSPGLGWQCLE